MDQINVNQLEIISNFNLLSKTTLQLRAKHLQFCKRCTKNRIIPHKKKREISIEFGIWKTANEIVEALRSPCTCRKRRLEIGRGFVYGGKSRIGRGQKEVKVAIRVFRATRADPFAQARERERDGGVASLSPYQAETNLSWRITLAVSIYSDTRRISRERPTGPTLPPLSQCTPAIHLRCMSPDVRTLAHLQNSSPRETSLNRIDVCAIRVPLVLFVLQLG